MTWWYHSISFFGGWGAPINKYAKEEKSDLHEQYNIRV